MFLGFCICEALALPLASNEPGKENTQCDLTGFSLQKKKKQKETNEEEKDKEEGEGKQIVKRRRWKGKGG